MAEIQDRHREAAETLAREAWRRIDRSLPSADWVTAYAQALADQELALAHWLDWHACEHRSPSRDAIIRAATRVRSGEWRKDG